MAKDKVSKPAPETIDKKKATQDIAAAIDKKFGQGSIIRLGDRKALDWPCIPTGIYTLDNYVLGGGFPRSRISEVYGMFGSFKTSLALTVIANAQRRGEQAFFVDVEHALSVDHAKALGVDINSLLVSQPDSAEAAIQIIEELVSSGLFAVGVLDSIAGMIPTAEAEGPVESSNMGLTARLMGKFMRRIVGPVSKSNTCLLLLNQVRSSLSPYGGDVTCGGRAVPFFASTRLELRRSTAIKDGDTVVGHAVVAKTNKNKIFVPFKQTEFSVYYDRGFDKVGSLIDAAVANGVITKSGSWYSMDDLKLGQGQESVVEKLTADEQLYNKVYSLTRQKDEEGVIAA